MADLIQRGSSKLCGDLGSVYEWGTSLVSGSNHFSGLLSGIKHFRHDWRWVLQSSPKGKKNPKEKQDVESPAMLLCLVSLKPPASHTKKAQTPIASEGL